ncbi:hypothetical protein [Streptosporangium sp. CA-115845]|uniref:hypothetical protein n=1 Tax=Streptosporangium sp. CA-115845 TaxID=3240071 RepID=UPI003D8AC87C
MDGGDQWPPPASSFEMIPDPHRRKGAAQLGASRPGDVGPFGMRELFPSPEKAFIDVAVLLGAAGGHIQADYADAGSIVELGSTVDGLCGPSSYLEASPE